MARRRRFTRREATYQRRRRVRSAKLAGVAQSRGPWRIGVVTDDSPLAVAIGGADSATAWTDLRRLTSYTPTAGDVVLVLVQGNDAVVLGELV